MCDVLFFKIGHVMAVVVVPIHFNSLSVGLLGNFRVSLITESNITDAQA
jgi:hypothetical protein